MKILVIEDEIELQKAIKASLEKEQFVVEVASDFNRASEKIALYDYDCILLDITLPGGSGLKLLEALREKEKNENVIITSAKDSLEDKLKGLDLGADDYLSKPFHLSELNARVKALLRRKTFRGKNTIALGNASLNISERSLSISNQRISLNRKEFDVLNYFLVNKNRLVTKTALAEHVWGDEIDQVDSYDFIYYQLKNLRKKLQTAKASIEIESIYGVGYKLVEK